MTPLITRLEFQNQGLGVLLITHLEFYYAEACLLITTRKLQKS